jgi:hypothetical protein
MNLYTQLNITEGRERRMGEVGHVAQMGQRKNESQNQKLGGY